MKRQQASGNKEIDPTLEKPLHAVIVVLKEQCRQELQLHLLACRIRQFKDAQKGIVAVRSLVFPICWRKAKHLVTLGRPMPRSGLKALAFHIQNDSRPLPGQQVRNDKACCLTAARRGDDQSMREGLRADKRRATGRLAKLADDKACAGFSKEAIALHFALGLPVGVAKPCQC